MCTSRKTTIPRATITRAGHDRAARQILDLWLHRLQHNASPYDAFLKEHQAHLRQALILLARQRIEPERFWELIQRAHRLFMAAGWVQTWACTLQQIVDLWPQLPSLCPSLAESLATAWSAAGRWEQAHVILLRHAPETLVPTEGAARFLLHQASLFWNQGQWAMAYRIGRQAWDLLPPEASHLLRTQTARLLLLASWRLGQVGASQTWGHQALHFCPKEDAKQRGLTHHFLFLIAWDRREPEAVHHLHQAIECLQAAGDRLNLAHVLADSTELYLAQGLLSQAEETLAQSYFLWRDMEDPAGLADYYRHAAKVAWALGRRKQAQEFVDYAIHLWRKLGHPNEAGRCQRLLRRFTASSPDSTGYNG